MIRGIISYFGELVKVKIYHGDVIGIKIFVIGEKVKLLLTKFDYRNMDKKE